MDEIKKEIAKTFGNELRVRVSGICVLEDRLLLVKHRGLGKAGTFWAPPGGGMHFGESATDALVREFREETGLDVEVKRYLCVNEYLGNPLHAVELFFEVGIQSGELLTGHDPEMQQQLIMDVRWWEWGEIRKERRAGFHTLLSHGKSVADLLTLQGYFFSKG
jgi:8-oxo-dGTP diphosphatase